MTIHYFRTFAATGCLAALIAAPAAAQDHNKLTTTETSAGYDLLFNGMDLNNWHAYRADKVTDAWTVKTNAPLGPRIEAGNGNKQPILTNKKYMNFDLKMDVQTPVDGNSGIFTRYEEVATSSANSRTGPEFQVCGPSNSDCASATKHFGSSYDMFGVRSAIRNTWYNPPGSWNQIRIVAFDSNYVHYGNGKKLLEYKIGTQEYLAAYNASKYVSDGNNGRYYHIHPGGFLLQHHGEIGITFRNAKAKELDMHPFKREFLDGKWPDELPQEYVFGATTSLAVPAVPSSAPELSVAFAGAGVTLIKVAADHSGFSVAGIDGREIPFRKTAEGFYSIVRRDRAPGVAIVRLRAGGTLLTKIVALP